jgi:hypothetical protein
MKKIALVGFFILILSKLVFADELIIAHGENPQGKTYFAYTGLVSKKNAGWHDNGIEKGIFEVVLSDENLDLRFIDASKNIKSARAQGGKVITLNKKNNEVTIFVVYPAETIEAYTFFVDNDGKKKFIMSQVKSGENALITQSSIFTGLCEFIHFDRFPE